MKTKLISAFIAIFAAVGQFSTCYCQAGDILSSPLRNVILLTDNPGYAPGETISFSALVPAVDPKAQTEP